MIPRLLTVPAVVAAALFTGPAAAQFLAPQSWTRGAGNTTYQLWEGFSDDDGSSGQPITDSTPDAVINPNGTPTLVATFTNTTATIVSPGVTGSGAIYGAFNDTSLAVTVPELDVPTPPHDVTAIVQMRTNGTEADYNAITLNGLAPQFIGYLSRQISPNPFPDPTPISLAEVWMLFNVPYASFGDGTPGPQDLTLNLESAAQHFSIQALSIDTAIRPLGFYNEPRQGDALFGLAGDYNGSGSVEQGDLDLVLNNWGGTRGDWSNANGFASANVDQEELDRVLNNWGSTSAASFRGIAVPEPAAGLAVIGLLGLSRRRRVA